jgi:hypothetical protein
MNYASSSAFTSKYVYDCAYVVSGKGMKVAYTGNMDYTSGSSSFYVYKLNYRVYDNTGTVKYNFSYNITQ